MSFRVEVGGQRYEPFFGDAEVPTVGLFAFVPCLGSSSVAGAAHWYYQIVPAFPGQVTGLAWAPVPPFTGAMAGAVVDTRHLANLRQPCRVFDDLRLRDPHPRRRERRILARRHIRSMLMGASQGSRRR